MSSNDTYDAVIVGGGMAGLSAAARATEFGLSVAVLEKGEGERYPCNARMSGGVFHVAFNDIKSPSATLRAAIDTATAGAAEAGQAQAVADNAGALVDWLGKQGARFIRTKVAWQNYILAPPRPLRAGIDWIGRGPDVVLRQLVANIEKRGGKIHLGTRAKSLVMQRGQCVGVKVERAGQELTISARAVVLADGGFQSNTDMLREHITPAPAKLKQRGGVTGAGDGLRMAREAGAAITALDRFYGHLLCRDAMHSDAVWPYPELDGIATSSILVNDRGVRFLDEGRGGVWIANTIAKQADPLCATIIFDSKIWEGPGRSARIPANPTLESAGGTIHRAPTLAGLAEKAGVPAAALETTVANYNAAVRNDTFAALSPARTPQKFTPWPIEAAPFFAIPACAGITYTMGGIRIDGESRVLREDGSAIDGLYAAGTTTGGLEGGEPAAYLGGLTKAGVQGLCAAEHIARTLKT
jgi:fumarate reductase flavoprotein subunit